MPSTMVPRPDMRRRARQRRPVDVMWAARAHLRAPQGERRIQRRASSACWPVVGLPLVVYVQLLVEAICRSSLRRAAQRVHSWSFALGLGPESSHTVFPQGACMERHVRLLLESSCPPRIVSVCCCCLHETACRVRLRLAGGVRPCDDEGHAVIDIMCVTYSAFRDASFDLSCAGGGEWRDVPCPSGHRSSARLGASSRVRHRIGASGARVARRGSRVIGRARRSLLGSFPKVHISRGLRRWGRIIKIAEFEHLHHEQVNQSRVSRLENMNVSKVRGQGSLGVA